MDPLGTHRTYTALKPSSAVQIHVIESGLKFCYPTTCPTNQSAETGGIHMKQLAWALFLVPFLACQVEEQPQKVADQQLGFSAIFPGKTTTARYTESTPFGEIEWFNTSYTGYTGLGKINPVYFVDVGTLPPGEQGGTNQTEILETLKEWTANRYPGQLIDLTGDRGPGYEYIHSRTNQSVVHGIIVLRRGRLHNAQGTAGDLNDPQLTAFLSSFEVDP